MGDLWLLGDILFDRIMIYTQWKAIGVNRLYVADALKLSRPNHENDTIGRKPVTSSLLVMAKYHNTAIILGLFLVSMEMSATITERK